MKSVKLNTPVLIVSGFMILVSTVNFILNGDSVSLGIFIFLGLGFSLLSTQPVEKSNVELKKRINKYAFLFFAGALVFIGYWLFEVKF